MKTNQCDRQRIDEFFRDETVGTGIEWTQHLETCEDCRAYFDSQAAQPEQWSEARRLFEEQVAAFMQERGTVARPRPGAPLSPAAPAEA